MRSFQEGLMKLFPSKVIAITMTGLMSVSSVMPVQAQDVTLSFGQRQRVVQTYCERNPFDPDCRGYFDGYWTERDYDWFYHRNRSDLDPLVAGIFGLAIGAIIAGAIANGNNNNNSGRSSGDRVIGRVDSGHVARCYARYKSYDERSDTFLGYDGVRHLCNL
jgi:hypothetical protein